MPASHRSLAQLRPEPFLGSRQREQGGEEQQDIALAALRTHCTYIRTPRRKPEGVRPPPDRAE